MPLFAGIELPGHPDLSNVRRLDLLPIPMIGRMSRLGMAIDRPYLLNLGSEFDVLAAEHERNIASYIPPERLYEFTTNANSIEAEDGSAEFNAGSAEQICTLLFDMLGVGKDRELKRTKGGRLSTGKKQLELLRTGHPIIGEVLSFRELKKLKSTYCDALPAIARFHPRGEDCPACGLWHEQETWRVHGEVVTTRAATGRMAHRRPNLANIPARTKNGGRVRAGFIASPGRSGLRKRRGDRRTKLVSRDFGQIELRDLAHCANAASMIEVYKQDKDIHIYTACATFNLDEQKYSRLMKDMKDPDKKARLSKEEIGDALYFSLNCRLPSKNLNFMIVYGATVIGLLSQLALSGLIWTEEEGLDFIRRWFALYPEVREYMELMYYRARRYGLVWDLFGRIRLIPEVRSYLKWIAQAGLRQGGNMPIQSCSAGQMKLAMGEIEYYLLQLLEEEDIWAWPLMTIHDQLINEVEEDETGIVDDIMGTVFSKVMRDRKTGEHRFRVPVKSDGEIMDRWVKE